jgi:hypothetical protein
MSQFFGVQVDHDEVVRAMEQLAPAVQSRTHEASRITATNIQREAEARVRRRTGETARGIRVEEDEDGIGYVVLSAHPRMPNLPIWLERGTVHMTARPYFDVSARLEEGPHRRRIGQALLDAIEEAGRG